MHRKEIESVRCWVITVSDSRTPQTDLSGKLILQRLNQAGHHVINYKIIKDETTQILKALDEAKQSDAQAVILSGGTGLSKRDVTPQTIKDVLDREIEGFGEIFRYLSYEEVGAFAILSRALAGVMKDKLVFSLPGAEDAVRLAMDKLILPILGHAVYELSKPTNA
jgi:molybdenum cofactor biosynthesis protein B